MRKIFTTLVVVILCLLTGCTQTNNTTGSVSQVSASETPPIDSPNMEEAALAVAQNFIRSQYASDAVFRADQVSIEPTKVTNRYKIMQRFDSEARDGYNFVYRIWVQKFPSGWEFGNLDIERAGGERVLTTNGRMKDLERQEMTRTEGGSADGVEYTIIKRNAPNYVRVYTPTRLGRDDVLKVYNQLKDQYEQVQFSKSRNPNDDDYLAILYGSVYEYDIDKITKLENY